MNKFIFFLLLFISGCQSWPRQQEGGQSLLDTFECGYPCWQNIVPGKTSEKEANTILETSTLIDQKTIKSYAPSEAFQNETPERIFDKTIHASLTSDFNCNITLYIINDKVVVISFSFIEFPPSIEDVIKTTADPEYVVVNHYYAEDYSVGFSNVTNGVAFMYSTLNKPREQLISITPDIKVDMIHFFDFNFYEQFLSIGSLTSTPVQYKDIKLLFEVWKGYGKVGEKYHINYLGE